MLISPSAPIPWRVKRGTCEKGANLLPCCHGQVAVHNGSGNRRRRQGTGSYNLTVTRVRSGGSLCGAQSRRDRSERPTRRKQPVTAGAGVAPTGGRRTFDDLTPALLNRQRDPV